ncbi:related to mannosylphosphorylation protein MNN4 [Rhynchosporium agropyri]|uniref:Related to mannosylphosphorylation protein MNN4 n=1 Tax=Rhynchosporium agropyri TaxID=914238 RepID=A0A1E1L8C6_9HELO|nr:related to mannosylphosphorylation protein MNN4 [Rhynchosporium agropyri]
MRLIWLLALPAVLSLSIVSALAIRERHADLYSVRTRIHKDLLRGKGGDAAKKYFHFTHIMTAGKPEQLGSIVLAPDAKCYNRFADHQLGYQERKKALSNLVQTYLATFSDLGVETWLMHGTLLGWWWNRKLLPWDSDSDVQVTEASMHYLASYYNMSVFHYKTPRIPEGRDYMLEVNPNYVNREQTDTFNVIDARWVDTSTGLFIDITTARYNHTHPAGLGMLSCKDGHEYRDSYIFPLRDTFFEGMPAKIPVGYKALLEAEYKEKALTSKYFAGHRFDDQKYEWIPALSKGLRKEEADKIKPKKEVSKTGQIKQKEAKQDDQKLQPAKQATPSAQEQQKPNGNDRATPSTPQPKKDASTLPTSQMPVPVEINPEKGEVSKVAKPQQPAVQRVAEEKMAKEIKKEETKMKTEEKRKMLEEKALMKEDKRLASQKKADEKIAAIEAKQV